MNWSRGSQIDCSTSLIRNHEVLKSQRVDEGIRDVHPGKLCPVDGGWEHSIQHFPNCWSWCGSKRPKTHVVVNCDSSSGFNIGNATINSDHCGNRSLMRVTASFSWELANNLNNDIVAMTLDVANESLEERNVGLISVGVVPVVFRGYDGIRAGRDLGIFKVVWISLARDVDPEAFGKVGGGRCLLGVVSDLEFIVSGEPSEAHYLKVPGLGGSIHSQGSVGRRRYPLGWVSLRKHKCRAYKEIIEQVKDFVSRFSCEFFDFCLVCGSGCVGWNDSKM